MVQGHHDEGELSYLVVDVRLFLVLLRDLVLVKRHVNISAKLRLCRDSFTNCDSLG